MLNSRSFGEHSSEFFEQLKPTFRPGYLRFGVKDPAFVRESLEGPHTSSFALWCLLKPTDKGGIGVRFDAIHLVKSQAFLVLEMRKVLT